LSLSKGGDRTVVSDYSGLINYSSNPAVFTDASCYLEWIAAQYGLSMPAGYNKPASCSASSGDKLAVNNTNCLSRTVLFLETTDTPRKCDFNSSLPQCKLFSEISDGLPNYKNISFYFAITPWNSLLSVPMTALEWTQMLWWWGARWLFLLWPLLASLQGPACLALLWVEWRV
jgi:hypothetical protein